MNKYSKYSFKNYRISKPIERFYLDRRNYGLSDFFIIDTAGALGLDQVYIEPDYSMLLSKHKDLYLFYDSIASDDDGLNVWSVLFRDYKKTDKLLVGFFIRYNKDSKHKPKIIELKYVPADNQFLIDLL